MSRSRLGDRTLGVVRAGGPEGAPFDGGAVRRTHAELFFMLSGLVRVNGHARLCSDSFSGETGYEMGCLRATAMPSSGFFVSQARGWAAEPTEWWF